MNVATTSNDTDLAELENPALEYGPAFAIQIQRPATSSSSYGDDNTLCRFLFQVQHSDQTPGPVFHRWSNGLGYPDSAYGAKNGIPTFRLLHDGRNLAYHQAVRAVELAHRTN